MKRLLIDGHGAAVRMALMSDATLKEIFIDPKTNGSMVGQIVLGVVRNILPSQFVFIDIGRDKNAFMNLRPQTKMKAGQSVLVQVQKDATGTKGANVTAHLHWNGRLAILYESERREIGVSQKITDKTERSRLHSIADRHLPTGFGAILRTNSAGKPEAEICADLDRLLLLRRSVIDQARYRKAPAVLYRENPLFNDLLADDLEAILVNDADLCEQVRQIVHVNAPALAERVMLYDEPGLFGAYGVEAQIEKALRREVPLPCGGFITVEQTEACVIVDVNTGRFPGRDNYRETVLQVNMEAAVCIAEQLALRNLSGMIIVDFIDMREEADKARLIRTFGAALKQDRVKTAIVGMTELGLVQLTRRKTRESLSRLLESKCPHCGGSGRVGKKMYD